MRAVLFLPASLALVLITSPATADDITDSLQAALDAYVEGDTNTAMLEAELAVQLLGQLKAQNLEGFLPEPMPGWTFEGENQTAAAAAFGGGAFATGRYEKDGEIVEIQLVAGNDMVASMAMIFNNPALLAASGSTIDRIGGQRFAISPEGEVMGMVGEVLVQVTGSAPKAVKTGYLEKMKLDSLAEQKFK